MVWVLILRAEHEEVEGEGTRSMLLTHHRISELSRDQRTMAELAALIGQNWESPQEVLHRAFQKVEMISIHRNKNRSILFFVTWKVHAFEKENKNITRGVYLGIGAMRHDLKGQGNLKGFTRQVIEKAQQSFEDRKEKSEEDFFAFTITSSPVVVQTLSALFPDDFCPRSDGSMSPGWSELIPRIKDRLGVRVKGAERYPLLLRGHSSYRFNPRELARLHQLSNTASISLFEKLKPNISGGDRLLLLFRPPAE